MSSARRGRKPKITGPGMRLSPLGRALERLLRERGLSQRGLSLAAGVSGDTVRNIISGRSREPRAEVVAILAAHLGLTVENLLTDAPSAQAPSRDTPGIVELHELQWNSDRARSPHPAAGLRKEWGQAWSIPADALGGRDVEGLVIYRCTEDAIGFCRGDRLFVDTVEPIPSPSGNFVIWDGYGVSVGRCAIARGVSGSLLRIESGAGTSEAPLSMDTEFLGRVIAKFGML